MFPTGSPPQTGGADFIGKTPQNLYVNGLAFGTIPANGTFSLLTIAGKGVFTNISIMLAGTNATAMGLEFFVDDTYQLNLYADIGATAEFVTYLSPNTRGFQSSTASLGNPLYISDSPVPFKKSIDVRVRNVSGASGSATGWYNIHYLIG